LPAFSLKRKTAFRQLLLPLLSVDNSLLCFPALDLGIEGRAVIREGIKGDWGACLYPFPAPCFLAPSLGPDRTSLQCQGE